MKFKTLTRPDGKEVYVNPEIVYFVMDAVTGPYNALAELIHSGGQVYVMETKEQVKAILEA